MKTKQTNTEMDTKLYSMKITTWNSAGISHKKYELEEFVERYKSDVPLLCETWLKPVYEFIIFNYKCYHNMRLKGKNGGTAI